MGIKRSVAALGALLAAALLLSVGCGSQWYTPARLWQARSCRGAPGHG